MSRRLELHEILKEILGSSHVYFQPPESVKMVYPAIRYELTTDDTRHADNELYKKIDKYTVTLIDKTPDSPFREVIELLQYCSFDRVIVKDNLYNYFFTLYY